MVARMVNQWLPLRNQLCTLFAWIEPFVEHNSVIHYGFGFLSVSFVDLHWAYILCFLSIEGVFK